METFFIVMFWILLIDSIGANVLLLAKQQQEIDATKSALEQGRTNLEGEANKLATETCTQKLELAKIQLALLEAHNQALEDLDSKVKKSPDFAIETCRNLNPGLSKPECETKIEEYRNGKKTEYSETQEKITETKAQIDELEMKCAGSAEATIDANGNIVTAGCKSWFDGCNTCKVGEPGIPMACTKMACDAMTMQPAKCMDDNSLVTAKEDCTKSGGVWSIEQSSCFEDPATMTGEGEK